MQTLGPPPLISPVAAPPPPPLSPPRLMGPPGTAADGGAGLALGMGVETAGFGLLSNSPKSPNPTAKTRMIPPPDSAIAVLA